MISSRYDSLFQYYAQNGKFPLDWQWLKAQAYVESGLDPQATSWTGAKGLAQFTDATWAEWANRLALPNADVRNPEHAIMLQTHYMTWLLERTGAIEYALAAYNWGVGNVLKLLKKENMTQTDWTAQIPAETRVYIQRVQRIHTELLTAAHSSAPPPVSGLGEPRAPAATREAL
jgi:soluble lytic murein transglycosylase-like protein